MTKIDTQFLRAVQDQGWQILDVQPDSVTGACPRMGCKVRAKLQPGASIPKTCGSGAALPEFVIVGYDEVRRFLRRRREYLGLSQRDAEECAGMAVDHLAKMEKDDPSRIPNIQTFIEWAQTLGYEVVLRPTDMPLVTLSRLSSIAQGVRRRLQRIGVARERREERRPAR